MHFRIILWAAFLLMAGLVACNMDEPESPEWRWPEGEYTPAAINRVPGFWEQKGALLQQSGLSEAEFIAFSTDSSWHLSPANRTRLRIFRNGVHFPDQITLLQKVIPLQDVALYMNNTYGGTVGGFLNVAADTKALHTQHDIYYGLRLDYPGTKFLPNGAGYAVIRFTSSQTQNLAIPYCEEMGGTYAHAWPNTGGGFTSSTLGQGGFAGLLGLLKLRGLGIVVDNAFKIGQVKKRRFAISQHALKALIAPRPLLDTEATGDLWANPEGAWITHLAASDFAVSTATGAALPPPPGSPAIPMFTPLGGS